MTPGTACWSRCRCGIVFRRCTIHTQCRSRRRGVVVIHMAGLFEGFGLICWSRVWLSVSNRGILFRPCMVRMARMSTCMGGSLCRVDVWLEMARSPQSMACWSRGRSDSAIRWRMRPMDCMSRCMVEARCNPVVSVGWARWHSSMASLSENNIWFGSLGSIAPTVRSYKYREGLTCSSAWCQAFLLCWRRAGWWPCILGLDGRRCTARRVSSCTRIQGGPGSAGRISVP